MSGIWMISKYFVLNIAVRVAIIFFVIFMLSRDFWNFSVKIGVEKVHFWRNSLRIGDFLPPQPLLDRIFVGFDVITAESGKKTGE